jgi:hypothetical protein
VPVKITVRFVDEPLQIEAVPDSVAVGDGVTVTIALPVMSGLGAVTTQPETVLVTLTMVYVVDTPGVTSVVAPSLTPLRLKLDVPSVYTTSKVPALKLKVSVAFVPEQMVVVPAMLAVGVGSTVISAAPVMPGSGAETLQPVAVFVTLTMVYVVFMTGLTLTVAPSVIPLALKLDEPSVYTTSYVPAGNVNVKGVELPTQIVAVPAMSAVGAGSTVISALPVILGLGAVTLQPDTVFVTLTMV